MAGSRGKLRALIVVEIVALAVLAGAFLLLIGDHGRAPEPAEPALEAVDVLADDPAPERVIPSGRTMPVYLQDDPQWGYVPYGAGTLSDTGCGLACAAMATEYITNQSVNPHDLSGVVGDTCLTAGVNDPGKFCEWIASAYPEYGIEHSEIYFMIDDALAACDGGSVVFASLEGYLGGRYYGGHIVLIWHTDGDGVYIRDPADGANSQRVFTRDEIRGVNWVYFYDIKGGHYGS